jgi:Zn-finger nucleic acid-binding protein
MRCPACDAAELDREGNCARCGGQWVDEEVVEQRTGDLELTGGGYSERHCPMCDEKMEEPRIFDVPIDRCAAHGLWFDKAELDEVLRRAHGGTWKVDEDLDPGSSLRGLIAAVRVWRES